MLRLQRGHQFVLELMETRLLLGRIVLRVRYRKLRPHFVEPALQAQPQVVGRGPPVAQDVMPFSRIGLQVIQLVATVLVVVNQFPGAAPDYR